MTIRYFLSIIFSFSNFHKIQDLNKIRNYFFQHLVEHRIEAKTDFSTRSYFTYKLTV